MSLTCSTSRRRFHSRVSAPSSAAIVFSSIGHSSTCWLVLTDDYEDVPVARFGSESSWADVVDEINTVSLFGSGGPRLAVVDEADSFVNAP